MLAPLGLSLLLAVLCAAKNYDALVAQGEQYCQKIVDPETQSNCLTCFQEAGSGNRNEINSCMKQWLPKSMARCANKQSDAALEACMDIAGKLDKAKEQRTKILVNVGQPQLNKVMDSKLVKDAGSAVFSIISQELFITDETLRNLVDDLAAECFERFALEDKDENWHLHHTDKSKQGRRAARPNGEGIEERHLTYSYGEMGVDMPFHGVGPLAVDVLKGKCIMEKLADAGKLDLLVETALNSPNPVPSWFFQDILEHITSITLPH